ncbi:glycosyltransferase family 39 protein [Aliirhizobium smilacinae]|uniref:glycosyltransferase family 39 protein n=1 Tax=Aliirhizobium smilacinae TaxID=1395944 RepID=UPI0015D64AB4|nr:glycosyltransferase family 39 protein [Rhizobium smilacinae]
MPKNSSPLRAHGTPVIADRLGAGQTLVLVLAAYFIIHVIVRFVLPHGLELDEAEQVNLSQWLLAGYGAQPPFYNWLQHGAIQIFGMSLVTLSGLKGLLLFLSYMLYYLAARQVLEDKRLAVVAALGLLTIPQISFEAQRDLSHTVAAIFGSSFFLYALLRVVSRPSFVAFLLFGIATGIGGITKYNFAILPIAAGLAVLMDRDMRRTVLSWKLLPAAMLAAAIVTPHALWLLDNFKDASQGTLKKLGGEDAGLLGGIAQGLGSLTVGFFSFFGITIIIFALVYREHLKAVIKANSRWTLFVGRILILSLVLIVLMILFAGFENVRDRWLTPVLLAGPLYIALKVDAAKIPLAVGLKRIWTVAAIIMVIIPAALATRSNLGRFTGNYAYTNIPFPMLAKTVAEKAAGANTLIVASDGQLGGNMHFNLPNLPVTVTPPPLTIESRPLDGFNRIVFVWRRKDGSPPPGFGEVFADYLRENGIDTLPQDTAIVGYPYAWGRPADQYRFAYAVMDLKR